MQSSYICFKRRTHRNKIGEKDNALKMIFCENTLVQNNNIMMRVIDFLKK